MWRFLSSSPPPEIAAYVQKEIQSAHVVLFTKSYCPYCVKAIEILRSYIGSSFTCNDLRIIDIGTRADCSKVQDYLESITGARTVPRIFIGKQCIGGCSDLEHFHSMKALAELLEQK
ncbi:glutaredoxin 1 [Echinococcus multilocularis]|uniref:Glutaredoxin-1 n=1 Tax=Echinococcus multilocularis TaxID=6211 RepID=A0A087VYT1_ECHMU|nr:glutaredoxin 1 [Echinococcus multilocularis]